jgi:pyrroloquinoline quinone (PQQ) biosynthesis protein C
VWYTARALLGVYPRLNYFLYQLNEEQYHPDLAKKFGLASGLQEGDFQRATPGLECLAHTNTTIHGMLMGSAADNRASALVNESMVYRYSEEHLIDLRKHYGLDDKALQFFTVHAVADQEHTKMAAEVIAKHAITDYQQQLVREAARHRVRFKIAKFDGIYDAYA